jgi:hypothetical protein
VQWNIHGYVCMYVNMIYSSAALIDLPFCIKSMYFSRICSHFPINMGILRLYSLAIDINTGKNWVLILNMAKDSVFGLLTRFFDAC